MEHHFLGVLDLRATDVADASALAAYEIVADVAPAAGFEFLGRMIARAERTAQRSIFFEHHHCVDQHNGEHAFKPALPLGVRRLVAPTSNDQLRQGRRRAIRPEAPHEHNEAALRKMLPPHNLPLAALAAGEGISEATV